jgi:hypothetical protein
MDTIYHRGHSSPWLRQLWICPPASDNRAKATRAACNPWPSQPFCSSPPCRNSDNVATRWAPKGCTTQVALVGHTFGGAFDTPKRFLDALVHLTSPWHEHLGRPIRD